MKKLNEEGLLNDKKVHVVALKLDKRKQRDLALRQYLDRNYSIGIDRKESILRLFEMVLNKGVLDKNIFSFDNIIKTEVEEKENEEDEVDEVKIGLNYDIDIDDMENI